MGSFVWPPLSTSLSSPNLLGLRRDLGYLPVEACLPILCPTRFKIQPNCRMVNLCFSYFLDRDWVMMRFYTEIIVFITIYVMDILIYIIMFL